MSASTWPRAAGSRTSAAGGLAAAGAPCVGVLAVAAAVSAALAALALVSRERATDQEALATSRELAASAISVLDRDPELSVLLALEAAEAAEPTYESVSALHEGLREHRTLWTLPGESEVGELVLTPLLSSFLSPDGRSVLVARLNRLEVWDVHGSAPRWDNELEKGESVYARFSTDGAQVVGAVAWAAEGPAPKGARQGIFFWDAATGREVRYVPGGPCPAHAFSQNGPFVDPGRPVAGIAYALSTGPGDGPPCDLDRAAITHLDLRTGEQRELDDRGRARTRRRRVSAYDIDERRREVRRDRQRERRRWWTRTPVARSSRSRGTGALRC